MVLPALPLKCNRRRLPGRHRNQMRQDYLIRVLRRPYEGRLEDAQIGKKKQDGWCSERGVAAKDLRPGVIKMNHSYSSPISRFIPACSWHRPFHKCDEGEKRILRTRGRRSKMSRRRLILNVLPMDVPKVRMFMSRVNST